MTKIGIIQYPSSNCGYDTQKVLEEEIGVKADLIWYKEKDKVFEYDGLVLPGGFSYGDYLRAGAIAAHAPISKNIKRLAKEGKPILGICNGFQVLTELKLLPGALMTNKTPKFLCKHVNLRVESTDSFYTNKFEEGEVISLPIAHKEGNYYIREKNLFEIEKNNRIPFKYSGPDGEISSKTNPNGSTANIAATFDKTKNVLGMMPHPERASEEVLKNTDGKRILEGMVEEAQRT
ncbi:phosphoribosylformylglycinamidine synthase I [archaeon SCG-AAA382B04]|nr:phosphoribosylformylglycinamidine synthase I [archaeon SCG-AAA382B04]